eukprot:CAMPEP_0119351204 /NCGR_PEP_ID=MMETSP1334-20130426/508_1 /TAXON_ID=127549 /ORGANISM="Calcidiscus leptoporus, Strain RCC1130" /LENGTH=54 /DNA_ID=CAMNT_0007363953 /DNA_START=39 /DNA_END=203 /DNA_ORIENTATION=+
MTTSLHVKAGGGDDNGGEGDGNGGGGDGGDGGDGGLQVGSSWQERYDSKGRTCG